jgi:hypothetical protein
METLRKEGLSLIVSGVKTIKNNPIPTAIITVLLLVSTYVLVNQFKK